MIKKVYMTGKIDDYVVDFMYPNVHIVLESGSEFEAPIYSPKMYELCRDFGASHDIMRKIDKLYAEFLESLKNMNPDDPLTEWLMRRIKENKQYAAILGL